MINTNSAFSVLAVLVALYFFPLWKDGAQEAHNVLYSVLEFTKETAATVQEKVEETSND